MMMEIKCPVEMLHFFTMNLGVPVADEANLLIEYKNRRRADGIWRKNRPLESHLLYSSRLRGTE